MNSESSYFIVRIQPNPSSNVDPIERKKLGGGHHRYIDSLVDKGVIVVGGPIEGKPGGLLIVRGESVESVSESFSGDPMVAAGALQIEVNPWKINHGDATRLQ